MLWPFLRIIWFLSIYNLVSICYLLQVKHFYSLRDNYAISLWLIRPSLLCFYFLIICWGKVKVSCLYLHFNFEITSFLNIYFYIHHNEQPFPLKASVWKCFHFRNYFVEIYWQMLPKFLPLPKIYQYTQCDKFV